MNSAPRNRPEGSQPYSPRTRHFLELPPELINFDSDVNSTLECGRPNVARLREDYQVPQPRRFIG